jgi:hypothetical protein
VFFWIFILIKIFTIATEGYAYSLTSMFSHLYSEDIQNEFGLLTTILGYINKFQLPIFIVSLVPFLYFLFRTRAIWWKWLVAIIFLAANVIEVMLITQLANQDVGSVPEMLLQFIGVQALSCVMAGLAVWILLKFVKLNG